MRKTVLVIFPDEVNACIAQFPWFAKEMNWLCLSIDALDRCLQLQLPHVEMPNWLQATGTFSANEYQKIFSKLNDLEELFVQQRNSMGFNEHAYWNHQHNLVLLNLISSAQKSALLAVDNIPKSSPILILHRMGVSDYHFSGGLLAAIFRDKLQSAGFQIQTIYLPLSKLVSAYAPTVYSSVPNYWSSEMSINWQKSESNVLISPSGLFYKTDQEKLLQLMQKLGVSSKTWTLAPPFWNIMPDGAGFKDRISVQSAFDGLSSSLQQALMTMVESMTLSTNDLMLEILGGQIDCLDFYQNQIQRIKQRHLFQCLTFLGMAHLSSIKPIEALVVSNLDGGINGPLFSVAIDGSSPCYMLPHSRVVNQNTDGPCTVITEYWQPKPSMTYRGEVNPVIHVPSEKCSENIFNLQQQKRSQKVLILFNGIHRWTHINTSLDFFKNIFSDISKLCLIEGVELNYRLKPGDQTPLDAYTHLLGIDRALCQIGQQERLDVLLKNTELVISIDDPSSALWEAIEMGCAVVLIANRSFPRSTLIDQDILKSYSPEAGLALIGQLLTDKNKLNQMQSSQLAKLHRLRDSRLVN